MGIVIVSVLAGLVLLWVLVNLKTSRPDGTLVRKLHPYRRMLAFLMPGRNESVVYYEDPVRAEKLLDYIARARQSFPVDITHCLVKAAAIGLHQNPRMNQFVAGMRLYARNHVAVTFSMKRQKGVKEAKLAAVKLRIERDEPFRAFCERVNARIGVERSPSETYTDKELGVLTRLPRPLLAFAVRFVRWLDHYNLVPRSFIENDGFFTSMFIANLGSVGMAAAYHHLYEYGTCPLFLMVGQVEERPVVENGEVVVRKILPLRWSYDERIDDGLTSKFGMASVRNALENPDEAFGPLDDAAAPAAAARESDPG